MIAYLLSSVTFKDAGITCIACDDVLERAEPWIAVLNFLEKRRFGV
jgi:hypothetical protein